MDQQTRVLDIFRDFAGSAAEQEELSRLVTLARLFLKTTYQKELVLRVYIVSLVFTSTTSNWYTSYYSSMVVCDGECNSGAVYDECSVCGGDGSSCCSTDVDCNGDCGGTAVIDSCDVCDGYGSTCTEDFCADGTVDCDGECDGTKTVDEWHC